MRIRRISPWMPVLLACLTLTMSHPAAAQQTSPAPSGPTGAESKPAIDPAKEADIRRLLDLAGGGTIANQIVNTMIENMRPLLMNSLPPGDYREEFISLFSAKFRSKVDAHLFVEIAVPIYDKYLSDEDVKGLIQFYGTPLGQKTLTVLPKLSAEMQSEGSKWGENMGRQCVTEILSERPDLAAALQQAGQQGAGPR